MEKTTMKTCAKGTCDLGTQQNGVTKETYILKCSNDKCGYIANTDEMRERGKITCPECGNMLYWHYIPQDGLTDYQRRMIKRFYGNTTDTKVVIQN